MNEIQRRRHSELILRLESERDKLVKFYDWNTHDMVDKDLHILSDIISVLNHKISELKQF
jgi:hypothetical protein